MLSQVVECRRHCLFRQNQQTSGERMGEISTPPPPPALASFNFSPSSAKRVMAVYGRERPCQKPFHSGDGGPFAQRGRQKIHAGRGGNATVGAKSIGFTRARNESIKYLKQRCGWCITGAKCEQSSETANGI